MTTSRSSVSPPSSEAGFVTGSDSTTSSSSGGSRSRYVSTSSESGIVLRNLGLRLARAVTCHVCLEIYKSPKLLPCGHIACLSCVEFLLSECPVPNNIICALCNNNKEVDLGPDGLGGLRAVPEIDVMCAKLRAIRELPVAKSGEEVLTCYHILESPSTKCPHCSRLFCEACLLVHCEKLKADFLSSGAQVKERLLGVSSHFEQKIPEIEATLARRAGDKTSIRKAFSNLIEGFASLVNEKEKQFFAASDKLLSLEIAPVKKLIDPVTKTTMISAIDKSLYEIMKLSSLGLPVNELTAVNGALGVLEAQVAISEQVKNRNFDNLHVTCSDFTTLLGPLSQVLDKGVNPAIHLKVEEKPADAPVVIYVEPIASSSSSSFSLPQPQVYQTNGTGVANGEHHAAVNCDGKSDYRNTSVIAHRLAQEGSMDELKRLFQSLTNWTSRNIRRLIDSRDEKDNGRTLLHQASSVGNVEMVRYLKDELHAKVDIVDKSSHNCLPISLAAAHGHLNVVACLLMPDEGGSNNSHCLYNVAALRIAIVNGHIPLVKFILSRCPSSARILDHAGRTLLHYAAECGHTAVVIELMRISSIRLDQGDKDGNSCFHLACKHGKLDVVAYLKDIRPDVLQFRNHKGESALDLARSHNQTRIVNCIESKKPRLMVNLNSEKKLINKK